MKNGGPKHPNKENNLKLRKTAKKKFSRKPSIRITYLTCSKLQSKMFFVRVVLPLLSPVSGGKKEKQFLHDDTTKTVLFLFFKFGPEITL